jgi:hypothetical protein
MGVVTTAFSSGGVVAGATVRASRPDRANEDLVCNRLHLALIALAVLLALLTFRDYGVTWDEDAHNWYGNFVLDYYLSLFSDRTALHWRDLYNYGAVFDTVAAALNRISPIGVYETRHLLNSLIGILGVVGCGKLGRVLGGARTGLIAALFLMLTPNYYGQMFNNPKDIPFAVGVVWATYYMVSIVPLLPRPPIPMLIKLGVAVGMTMGVRIGGLLLLCEFGLLLALDGVWRMIGAWRTATPIRSAWVACWRAYLLVVLVAYPVMLLFWGRFVPASDLPWTYLPTYIAVALPELILVLLLCAPIVAAAVICGKGYRIGREQALAYFILGFGLVFPVGFAILIKAVLFDGMRHFMFVLPLIAVVAALVGGQACARLARSCCRWPIYGALAIYGLAHVSVIVMLHPNQYIYYNAFVGGVEGAQRKFKLDYWANSYAEAVQGLESFLITAYGLDFEDREFTVAVCGPPISADYYFPANFRYTHQRAQADFFIAFTKDNCDRALPGRPVYRVERMGALLSVVLDRREDLTNQSGKLGRSERRSG